MTLSGFEPAIFRLVEHFLDQLRHLVPLTNISIININIINNDASNIWISLG
jgi:hypothetical protein